MKRFRGLSYWGACVILSLVSGCAQTVPFTTSTGIQDWSTTDFAFVSDGELQLVNQSGVISDTNLPAADTLPAVSKAGELVLYAEAIADKYQLIVLNTSDGTTKAITPLAALPSQLLVSDDPDLALMIVQSQLYLVFLPQQRLVRVHEGVEQALFSLSNQRVEYRTSDGRLLSREFAVDGSLAAATNLSTDPFVDWEIPERADQVSAGWSKQGLGVYSVDNNGNVTLIQYE